MQPSHFPAGVADLPSRLASRLMRIQRLGPVLGAEVSEVDLAAVEAADDVAAIGAALAEHEVLVFRDQDTMDSDSQVQVGRRFGELLVSPFSPNRDDAPELIILDYSQANPARLTDIWHADETYRAAPPKFTMLRALICPELGGDTMFASMRAAYAGLSDRMQTHIAGLTAVHGFGRFNRLFTTPEQRRRLGEVEQTHPHPSHPVVAVHPETGRRVLYVSMHFTEYINDLPDDEGRAILDFLVAQTTRPEVPTEGGLAATYGRDVGQPIGSALRAPRLLASAPPNGTHHRGR